METESLDCEGCGTALPAPDDQGNITCPSCGRVTHVDRPEEKPEAAPSITIDLGSLGDIAKLAEASSHSAGIDFADVGGEVAGATKTAGKGCAVGSVITLVVILAVTGGIIAAVVAAVHSGSDAARSISNAITGKNRNLITLSESIVPLSGGSAPGSDTPDVTAVIQDYSGSSHRYVARLKVSSTGISEAWRSPELPSDTSDAPTALVGSTVFAGVGSDVWALDAKTGVRRWIGGLSDKLQGGCAPTCFQAVGSTLVVRTADAYLSGFVVGSAEPRYHLRLTSTTAQAYVVGSKLFVADETEDHHGVITVRDGATGRTLRRVSPSCPSHDQYGYEVKVSAGDPVYAIPGSPDVLSVFGGGDGCVVRWDPGTGTVRWTSRLDGAGSIQDHSTLVSATDLVLATSSEAMVQIDLKAGTAKVLQPGADQTAKPLLLVGRELVASTTSSRGTDKAGLAAYGLVSGRRLWSVQIPQGAEPASTGPDRRSETLFDSSPRSVITTDGKRLLVAVFIGQDHRFTVQSLDLRSGASGPLAQRQYKSGYDSSMPSFTAEVVGPHRILVTIENLLQSISLTDDHVVTYPS